MNVLCMGQPFGADDSNVRLFRSTRGHEIRTLAAETGADYTFDPRDTAAEVVRRVAQAWPPDVLFCWVPEMYPPPRAVEDCPIKTVAATSDWNIYFPQIEYNLSRYDVVLTDKLGAESLRLWRTEPRYFFPLYSQRTPVHRKLDVEKDIDILYAGNLNYSIHVERGRLLEQVASLSDRRRVVIGGGFPDDEYTRLMNRARIAFNYGVRHEMNLRAFEALACNALLFLEEDNREVRDCLRDREHVVLYRQDNLVELLEFYLDHDDQAERIRAQGAAKAPELAGENRWGDLLDWIALQPARERPFGALPEPVRAFAELMQYASSQAPGQRVLVGEQIGDALDRYPDRPEFAAAAGSFALFNLRALSGAARKRSVRRIVQWFEQASALAPSEVVFRLNLAFVCRHGGATAGEIDCLERALDADGCGYGGLLLSPLEGYYANAWRRALALGTARIEMLWAQAAARLAELELGAGRFDAARKHAAQAIEWMPDIAEPYRIQALAEHASGDAAQAVGTFERGLPYTAFDREYRMGLLRAMRGACGRAETRARALESARLFRPLAAHADAVAEFREIAEGRCALD